MIQMYLQGSCSDYRWYYEGGPPGANDLLAALQAYPDFINLAYAPAPRPLVPALTRSLQLLVAGLHGFGFGQVSSSKPPRCCP